MSQAWGRRYERHPFAFISLDEPPPYYSHLTVLAPGHSSSIVSQLRVAADRGSVAVSLKDSFCDVGPHVSNFRILYEAFWLWRQPNSSLPDPGWKAIESELDLVQWETSWKRAGSPTPSHMFHSAMLRSPAVTFLGEEKDGFLVAGCIANLSPACVSISNVFSGEQDKGAFVEATAAVASISLQRPIVGYRAKNLFGAAEQVGFTRTGALSVLLSDQHLRSGRLGRRSASQAAVHR